MQKSLKNFNRVILFWTLMVSSLISRSQYINPGSWPLITTPVESIKNIDHNSIGFMVSLPNGDIVNIFRLDTGFTGNHIGNTGKIVKRYSYDSGVNWTTPETIYDSYYDDRNMSGGITDDGRIVCFFDRYNASTHTMVDLNVMYSDDFGMTWSPRQVINSTAVAPGTTKIFGNNTIGYYMANYNFNYIELLHSYDGIGWDSIVYIWDYRFSHHFNMTEASYEYLGNGVIIGLWRNESGLLGENFLQIESYDFGRTWTEPQLTNIANGFFCPSPWVFYDTFHNDIWVVATDRRADLDTSYHHNDEELWLYKMSPDEILGNPTGYILFSKFLRPSPSFYRFFGYPYSVRKQNGDYLVMLTENYYRHNTKGECAYLYQFDILYSQLNDINKMEEQSNPLLIFPNPFRDKLTVSGALPEFQNGPVYLEIYNSVGQAVLESEIDLRFDNSFMFFIEGQFLEPGIYLCKVKCGNFRFESKIIKPNN